MDIISLLNMLSGAIDALINLMPKVIALASVTAAFLPPGSGFVSWVNVVAFNFKHAENKT